MALQFAPDEYADRRRRLLEAMQEEKLDAMLLFAQESMYWLTGFDSFGFCFFQCLAVKADGDMALLARSADLRQARQTSTIDRVIVWIDRANADPTGDLRNLLDDMDLLGCRIGVEYDTHGLTGSNCRLLDNRLQSFANLADASYVVSRLRLVKSPAEIQRVRRAAELADTGARRGPWASPGPGPTSPISLPPCRARSLPAAATIRPTTSSSVPAGRRCCAATSPAGASSTKTISSPWNGPGSTPTITPP